MSALAFRIFAWTSPLLIIDCADSRYRVNLPDNNMLHDRAASKVGYRSQKLPPLGKFIPFNHIFRITAAAGYSLMYQPNFTERLINSFFELPTLPAPSVLLRSWIINRAV